VARAGLTGDGIVDVAAAIADRDGPQAVTLARLAAELGVRSPSLYHHVRGLDDVHRLLSVRALDTLGDRLQRATMGRAREEAVRAMADAYRDFARRHPGLYGYTLPSREHADEAVRAAAARVLDVATAVVAGFGLDEDTAVHAIRAMRSAVHGFLALDQAGGFALAVDLDTSFRWLIERLVDGMRQRG
jgi:AcrR family transcriptional regulator